MGQDRTRVDELRAGGGDGEWYWRVGSGDQEKRMDSRAVVEIESTGHDD